jgi:hypothetical protein
MDFTTYDDRRTPDQRSNVNIAYYPGHATVSGVRSAGAGSRQHVGSVPCGSRAAGGHESAEPLPPRARFRGASLALDTRAVSRLARAAPRDLHCSRSGRAGRATQRLSVRGVRGSDGGEAPRRRLGCLVEAAPRLAERATDEIVELVTTHGPERIRSCQASPCIEVFVDTSRNGRRRYCSHRCANRVNAARHRRRQRAGSA